MPSKVGPEETIVDESGCIAIPDAIRRRLGIEAGDVRRWRVDDAGTLVVDHGRYGAFGDFEPVAMGGGGTGTHDLAGHENDPADSE